MLNYLALKSLYTILSLIIFIAVVITLLSFKEGIIRFITKIIDTFTKTFNFLFGFFKDGKFRKDDNGIFREWPFNSLFLFFTIGLITLFIYLNQTGQLNTNLKYLSFMTAFFILFLLSYLLYDSYLLSNNTPYKKTDSLFTKIKFPIFERLKPLLMQYGIGILIFLAIYSILVIIIFNVNPKTFSAGRVINIFIAMTILSTAYYFLQKHLTLLGVFGKLLMYTVFLIPCIIHSIIKSLIRNEVKEQGNLMKHVIILSSVLILAGGYLFIPYLVKLFHGFSEKDDARKDNIELEINTLEKQIILLKAKKNKIKSRPDKYIDWGYISHPNEMLHRTEKQPKLKKYLESNKYTDDPIKLAKEQKLKGIVGIKVFSLTNIIQYIQENVPKIDDIDSKISENTQKIKELKMENSELGKTTKAKILLMKPLPLNQETFLASGNELNKSTNVYPNYNYAISSWIYLHPEPPNHNISISEFTNILQYGEAQKIVYHMKNQILKIMTFDREENKWIDVYTTDKLKLQKWNNILLNVNNSTIDIFINKDLVTSKINHLPILDGQQLIVGQNNGLSGGIANVVYYPSPLKKFKIDLLYNGLKNKSTPIV